MRIFASMCIYWHIFTFLYEYQLTHKTREALCEYNMAVAMAKEVTAHQSENEIESIKKRNKKASRTQE